MHEPNQQEKMLNVMLFPIGWAHVQNDPCYILAIVAVAKFKFYQKNLLYSYSDNQITTNLCTYPDSTAAVTYTKLNEHLH